MYDKSILAKSTGASLGVVAIVGMLFLSTGTAFALPISGIGGFTISAEQIEGENLKLYPAGQSDAPNDAENADQYPQGVVELTSTTITDLRLTKEFDLGQYYLPDEAGNARLVITAGDSGTDVTTEALLLKTPKLGAQSATFNGLTINEQNSTNIRETFTITASSDDSLAADDYGPTRQSLDLSAPSGSTGLILEQPNIRATYLTTSSITLPNLALEIQWDTNDNGNYDDPSDYGSASPNP